MKKLLITLVMMLAMSSIAMAQLGAPKITVKDTLIIVSCYYNKTELQTDDWPAGYIIEDAVSIQIADFVYKKGKPTFQETYSYNLSWDGHIDAFQYDATCNGKKASIMIVKPREDCHSDFYGKYVIDDYEFYVITLAEARKLFKQ